MDQLMRSNTAGAARTGAALLVGYMLGRTRRTKLMVAIGLAIAVQGMGGSRLTGLLGSGPLGKAAEEVAGSVAGAATQAFNSRVDRLADAVHARTAAMQGAGAPGGDD